MKKKILFVASSLGIGGMERVLVDISNELVKRDYDVTIITYVEVTGDSWAVDLDSRVKHFYKPPKDVSFYQRIPYVHRFYKKDMWETRVSARTLYKYYVGTKEKYDVEIAFCRGPAVKIVSGSPNKQSVKLTWVHNDYRLVDFKGIIKYFKDIEDAREAYKKFDRICAVSNEAGKSFVEVVGFPEKITTVYNMLDIDLISRKKAEKCPLKKNRFTVISVARLIPAKGYDTLLRAVKRLTDEGVDFNLWLVGSSNMDTHEKFLRQYALDNNLKNVTFTGRQMNPYCFMANADVYFCSSWREGFSISVAEALACGLPVISTRCTGPVEILGDGEYGVLIDYDENMMYEILKSVIHNPDLLTEYREKSIERSKRFSGEVIINEIVSLFEKKI